MKATEVKWLVNKQVILVTAYNLPEDILREEIIHINNLVNSSDAQFVHTIWNLVEMEEYPTSIQKISKAIQPLFTNPRLGWVLTVIQNPIVTFLGQVGSSIYHVRYHSFKNMNELSPFLQERDSNLPDLSGLISQSD